MAANIISRSLTLGALLVLCYQHSVTFADSLRPVQDIHDELLSKFTPLDQPDGDLGVDHFGDEPFSGDCDDYYTAAFNQLYLFGYDPYALLLRVRETGEGHVVACVDIDGWAECLDNNRQRTSSIQDLRRYYRIKEKREVN